MTFRGPDVTVNEHNSFLTFLLLRTTTIVHKDGGAVTNGRVDTPVVTRRRDGDDGAM